MKKPDSLMHRKFMEQRNIIDSIEVNNNITCRSLYCYSIKCLVDNLVFFYNFNADLDYVPLLVQRLRDQYVQQWHGVLYSQSTNGISYTMFKCDFNYEKYLDCISNNNVKRCFFSVQNIFTSFRV